MVEKVGMLADSLARDDVRSNALPYFRYAGLIHLEYKP